MYSLVELIGLFDEILSKNGKFLKIQQIRTEYFFKGYGDHTLFDHFSHRIIHNEWYDKAQNDLYVGVPTQARYEYDQGVNAVHKGSNRQ